MLLDKGQRHKEANLLILQCKESGAIRIYMGPFSFFNVLYRFLWDALKQFTPCGVKAAATYNLAPISKNLVNIYI